MTTLVQIEHGVREYDSWKAAFDRDPIHREAGGVRRYRIFRPVDDPNHVAVDLEFDDPALAHAFRKALHGMWSTSIAQATMSGQPHSRIVEAVEDVEL